MTNYIKGITAIKRIQTYALSLSYQNLNRVIHKELKMINWN